MHQCVLRALPLALVTIVVYFVFLQLQTHTKDSPKLPLRDSRRKGPLRVEDIFIAVKTTGRFHSIRLALLLDTWISRTKKHVSTITQSSPVALLNTIIRLCPARWLLNMIISWPLIKSGCVMWMMITI
uniref:MFNG O-fucosylpeptide 3-beta-N-acetylglucosaminyltransferase n=1 Tax=Astyanax mexicanus TaxID=7994 RepID=A0A3B1K0V5_ASTMX